MVERLRRKPCRAGELAKALKLPTIVYFLHMEVDAANADVWRNAILEPEIDWKGPSLSGKGPDRPSSQV